MSVNDVYEVDYIESHISSGSFTGLDVSATAYNGTAATIQPGVAVTPTKANEICFAGIEVKNGVQYAQSLYYLPSYGTGGGNNNTPGFGSSAVLYNTNNGAAENWIDGTSETSVVLKACIY